MYFDIINQPYFLFKIKKFPFFSKLREDIDEIRHEIKRKELHLLIETKDKVTIFSCE